MTDTPAPYEINGRAISTNTGHTGVIPPEVMGQIQDLVMSHANVKVELDYKDGVLINARYQEFWRRVGVPKSTERQLT